MIGRGRKRPLFAFAIDTAIIDRGLGLAPYDGALKKKMGPCPVTIGRLLAHPKLEATDKQGNKTAHCDEQKHSTDSGLGALT